MLGKFGINPQRGNRNDPYEIELKFETNNTSDPDGLDPDYGSDLAVAREGTGEISITFVESKKPKKVAVQAFHEEDDADLRVVSSGYVASTGVVTIKTYTNSAGTWSAADTTDKTVVVVLRCSDSDPFPT